MGHPVADRLAQEAQTILEKRIADNSLNLPPPPQVVMKTMALLRESQFQPKEAAALIERDAVLAARVIRAANAVGSNGEKVRSLPQAVTRLGPERLKTALVESSANRLFESRDQRIVDATKGLWEHALGVAMLSRDVAALCGIAETEAAYLAGLLHDIGKPVVAWLLLEAEKSVVGTRTNVWIEPDVWVEVINRVHRPVGVALAQKWGLPESISAAIADCNEYNGNDRLSVPNCVRFANALTKKEALYVGKFDASDIDALVMIGRSLLGIDDSVLARLSSGLSDRVRMLMN
ncbi:MAG: HDOD domain-containing protein [Myxococcaceae bacterium]